MEENKSEISIEQILKAIDFEIDTINKEATRPGWTKWAIYGAFAAIAWLLFGLYDPQSFNYINIAQLYISLAFISGIPGLFKHLYPDNNFQINNNQTFKHVSNFIDFEELGSNFILGLIYLFVTIFATNEVWIVQVIILLLLLLATLAFQIFNYWQLSVDFPFTAKTPKTELAVKLTSFLITISIIAPIGWAISGYFFAAYNRGISISDVKISLLLFALTFLYKKLFIKPVSEQIKNNLIELRRHIVLDNLDLDKAKFEFKKIIGNLSPSEFLRDLYNECSVSIVMEKAAIQYSTTLANDLKKLLADPSIDADLIKSKIEELNESFKRYTGSKKGLAKDLNKFNKNLKRVRCNRNYCGWKIDME